MNIIEYDGKYRTSAIELMCLLQDHERRLSSDRPPSNEISADQLDYLVAESHRGSRVASELLQHAEDFCHSHGLSIIKLSVLHTNAVARSFYEKKGYLPYEMVYRKVI